MTLDIKKNNLKQITNFKVISVNLRNSIKHNNKEAGERERNDKSHMLIARFQILSLESRD